MLGERNTAQQLYYGACEELDQQIDETIEVQKERNKFREERDRYKKERNQLKEQISNYEGVETSNSDLWAELKTLADSQSMIKKMEEDYEKRKRYR